MLSPGAVPKVDVGRERAPREEREELPESLVVPLACEPVQRAIEGLARDVLLAPKVLLRPIAAEVFDQRIVSAGLAAQGEPPDLLADLLRRPPMVHVHRELVRALEARLHRDAVNRFVVACPQGADPDPAGRDVAEPRHRAPREQEDRLAEERRAPQRLEDPLAVRDGHRVVEGDHVLPPVLLTALRIDRDPRGRSQPLTEPADEVVDGAPGFLSDRLATGEQHRSHEEGAQLPVSRRMRRAVRREKFQERGGASIDRAAPLGRAPRFARLVDERLEARVGERALAQRVARIGVEQHARGREEPLQRLEHARFALDRDEHRERAPPHREERRVGRASQQLSRRFGQRPFFFDDDALEQAHSIEGAILVGRFQQQAGAVQIDQVEVAHRQRALGRILERVVRESGRGAPLAFDRIACASRALAEANVERREIDELLISEPEARCGEEHAQLHRFLRRVAVDRGPHERDAALQSPHGQSGSARGSAMRSDSRRRSCAVKPSAWKSQFGKTISRPPTLRCARR